MKINKIISALIGFATFAFALCLNYRYAINDYGVLENSLSTQVLAQTTTGDGGSGSSNTEIGRAHV